MSHFPDDWEEQTDHDHDDRSTIFSSIAGSLVRGRGRSRTTNTLPTYEEEGYENDKDHQASVPLNNVPGSHHHGHEKDELAAHYPSAEERERAFYRQDTSYGGAGSAAAPHNNSSRSLKPPTPPPHSAARRQFSFNRVFRRAQAPTEEERAGLVVGEGGDRRGSDGREGEVSSRERSRERERDREAFI